MRVNGTFESVGVALGIQGILQLLAPHEEQVVRLRFGIGVQRRSVAEISALLGQTQGRVERIQARALRRLRESSVGVGVPALTDDGSIILPRRLHALAGGRRSYAGA